MRRLALVWVIGAVVVLTVAGVAVSVVRSRSGPVSSSHVGMVSGMVWVANEGGDSLTVIDASRNEVLTTLTSLPGPHNVQVSPDGRSVWAVSGHGSMAVMIDAASFAVHGTTATGTMPAHVVVTPDGRTAYTSNGDDDTVTAIDVATMRPVATIPVGAYPHGMRPSPDGRWLYVANAKSTTVSVIETASNKRVADIEVGEAPVQVAFAPDGRFAYASIKGTNAVAKIDVDRRVRVDTVAVGAGPIQVYTSPDGRYLLAANQGTEQAPGTSVSIIDTATFQVVKTVETGRGAHGVVVDPSSRHAYVTNIYEGTVAVIDLGVLEVVARIMVGDKPNGVSFSTTVPGIRPAGTIELPLSHDGSGHR